MTQTLDSNLHIGLLENLLSNEDKVLVAISGGRDSVALAHLLHANKVEIAFAHVNYGLRDLDSDLDAQFVCDLAKTWEVPVFVHKETETDWSKVNIQERARSIRYGFFDNLCQAFGYTKVATAHHADDNIETLFLHLLRGSGIDGLRGIPQQRDRIIRPLLQISRDEIDRYIAKNNLLFREDKSNREKKYRRNKIRHDLMTLLAEIDPMAKEKLRASLKMINADADAIKEMAETLKIKTDDAVVLDLSHFPKQSGSTWLYHSLRSFGFNRAQCRDLHRSISGARIESETHFASKKGDILSVSLIPKPFKPIEIHSTGTYITPNYSITIELADYHPKILPRELNHVWLDAETVQFPLQIREWNEGETFRPLGAAYDVPIGKYLKDYGLDYRAKRTQLVLLDRSLRIIYILGIQMADSVKCAQKTNKVLSIKLY